MVKEITVTRWIDASSNEHTTLESAEYEDARNTLMKLVADLGPFNTPDEVAEFVTGHVDAVNALTKAVVAFRHAGGLKLRR